MKISIKHIRLERWLMLLATTFLACNKESQQVEKAIQVVIYGYNGSDNALQVSIDTTVYDKSAAYGKHIIKATSMVAFNVAYIYSPNQQQRMVVITDTVTKKIVFSQPLPTSGTKAYFSYLYLDGKELAVQPPATDTATNKLGFYIRNADGNAPVDIFLYRIDNSSGQEYRTYLAKNVKPDTWIYVNYIAGEAFGSKKVLEKSSICFTKTGTTDQWAFLDDEGRSKLPGSTMSLPLTGEKGLVQPYFFIQGQWELEKARLFFYLDRLW